MKIRNITAMWIYQGTLVKSCLYKFFVAYKAGAVTMNMAKKNVEETTVVPNKVLMIQVDDFAKKKSGVFMINSADEIKKGSAMIREYEYKYPNKLDYISIPDGSKNSNKVDSLVDNAKGIYDCVRFCHDTKTKVYKLKEK